MSKGIDELSEVIDSLLDVDVSGLTDAELHELVTTVQRQRHRLAAVAATAISAWDRRLVWADNGARSAATRLANDTSASTSSTGTEIRRARQLRSMPATAAALAAGELSPDHVDLLGKANRPWRNASFSDHEETLVEQCKVLRFFDARKMVDYWCARADADASEDRADRQRNAAHLDVASTLDGTVVINGLLDPIGGSIVSDELTRLERELYLVDQRDGVTRTASQRRAAALVMMAMRSATAPADGRRPKPLFTVLVGDETLSQLCELANGTVITPGQLVRWMGDADLETVLFDGPSTVISVSHRRSFTGALRRAVEVRDRRCQHDQRLRRARRPVRRRPHRPLRRRRPDEPVQRQARMHSAQPRQRPPRPRRRSPPEPTGRPPRRDPVSIALEVPPGGTRRRLDTPRRSRRRLTSFS